jgi:hypothetical protein
LTNNKDNTVGTATGKMYWSIFKEAVLLSNQRFPNNSLLYIFLLYVYPTLFSFRDILFVLTYNKNNYYTHKPNYRNTDIIY